MVGEYVFNENDARPAKDSERTPYFEDSIAVGDYMMDSHATQTQEPDRPMGVLEGFFFIPALTKPYQIPYRILLPKNVDGLLVSVAVSATHVGYGTLRMEPVMMAMGEAAGVATQIARHHKERLRDVPMPELQRELLDEGGTLAFFSDLTADRPDFAAFQAMGSLGAFDSYKANPDGPLSQTDAALWLDATAKRAKPSLLNDAPWSGVSGDASVSADQWAKWLSAFKEKASEAPADQTVTRSQAAISLYSILSR
jgi:hypothetical protein